MYSVKLRNLLKLLEGSLHMTRLRLRVLRRWQYSVPGPNSLWHIDGNYKLIRWRFVVNGGVDGFIRLVVYLTVAGNNRACTVLQSFIAAVEQYGLPSRRGMWRDVYEHALDLFYQIFTSLEDQGTLNPDNEVHLFALHRIFIPLIQQSLDSFRDAWNFHGLRTERNQSPQQLWRRYREQGPMEDPTEVYEDYGIDWNRPHSLHGGIVSVPEVQLARELSDEEVAIASSRSDALRSYEETVQVIKNHSRVMPNQCFYLAF
ncbi:hypothetical protein L3Q82_020859 [Scortum barcoo]|uniref:Uncharacterized protein n=1 Tax=Scortum barcoo TaxID=214431 RepID=A0ACB8V9B3_9TELE|nr:hypothetical protein L3Q82_020859 [Scortum barcoo]